MAALVGVLLPASAFIAPGASAFVFVSPSPSFPDSTTVGETAPVAFGINNSSTPPDAAARTFGTIDLIPSCTVTAARVVGPITVSPGGALTVVNSQVTGGILADAPSFFSVCGAQVSGAPGEALRVTNTGVPIRIGDPPGCAGNRFAGQVSVTSNLAVTFGGNTVSHNATFDANGPGATVIKANRVFGTLACSANNPLPTNAGQVNTAGAKTGQCTAL